MTINAINHGINITPAANGKRYARYPSGNHVEGDYFVYPKLEDGIFSNDTIPNLSAKWRVISANDSSRWEFFDGGGYTFDSNGAEAGQYVAIYEVVDWDSNGNNANASITVTVT